MPIEAQNPAEAQGSPYSPPGPKPLVFEQWRGVNTNTTRMGVPDEQAAWIDGFFPLADRKARTMWGVGAALYTPASSIVCFFFGNIGSTPYSIVFLANGSVVAVNTTNGATTTILTAGTITNPSILNVGTSQWSNQYIIIVANQTNGYWLWNGGNVFTAGTLAPVVVMTNVGAGYATAPIVIIVGGHGSGYSLVASVANGQVVSVSVVNPGTGYLPTDIISIGFVGSPVAGSGASLNAFIGTVASTIGSGGFTLASITIVASGSLYNNPTITFTGGAPNVVPTAVAIVAAGSIVSTSIINRGNYATTVNPTIVLIDSPATASASIQLMPYGVQGTDAEVFAGHVWVINGPTVYFSAPGSFNDFSTSSGGSNFTATDSTLKNGYTRVIAANSVLYLVGDSSTTYISGVQTTGSPPTTTFTKLVVDPEVGSPYPRSVQTYGRDIMFANAYGVHIVAGAAAVKSSQMLDGVYNTVGQPSNNFNFGIQFSAAKAIVFGKKVWMELIRIVDPVTQLTQNKLMIWDGEKWFTSLQDVALTFINAQEINSVISAWGTNGTSLYPLFQQPSTNFTKRMRSRFWDAPGGYQWVKTATRLWAVGEWPNTSPAQFTVSVENEAAEGHPDPNAATYTFSSATVSSSVTPLPFVTQPTAIGQHGVLTGFTIETGDGDLTLASVLMQDEVVAYRG